jgi:hypothetical protein
MMPFGAKNFCSASSQSRATAPMVNSSMRGRRAANFFADFGPRRAIAEFRDDVLGALGEQEFEKRLRLGLVAATRDIGVDPGDVRLRENADRRVHDLNTLRLGDFAQGFVFPGQMDVPHLLDSEGDGGTARTLIENGRMRVKALEIRPRLRFSAPARDDRSPCGKRAQLAVAGGLGIGVTISTSDAMRSGQSRMCFGFPLRTTNTIVEV